MGGGGVDISSACYHHPFLALYAVAFNADLNTQRITHVFRGLCPNFARDLLKAIPPLSLEIEQDLGSVISEY